MIVNSAYPYMAKSAPANPVIFDGPVVNYKYEGTAKLMFLGFQFSPNNNVSFYNVNCKNRTSLAIVGDAPSGGYSLELSVKFLKNGEETRLYVNFTSGISTKTVAIPAKYQTNDVTVTFSVANLPAMLLLKNATLS